MQSWSTYSHQVTPRFEPRKKKYTYAEQRKWLSMTSFIEFINTFISVG